MYFEFFRGLEILGNSAYNLSEFLWYMLGYPRIILLEFSLVLRLR